MDIVSMAKIFMMIANLDDANKATNLLRMTGQYEIGEKTLLVL